MINKRFDGVLNKGEEQQDWRILTIPKEEELIRHIKNKNRYSIYTVCPSMWENIFTWSLQIKQTQKNNKVHYISFALQYQVF